MYESQSYRGFILEQQFRFVCMDTCTLHMHHEINCFALKMQYEMDIMLPHSGLKVNESEARDEKIVFVIM